MKAGSRKQRTQLRCRWMDYKTAAEYICVSESTVKRMVERGLLTVTRVPWNGNGKTMHPRVDRLQIDRLMETYLFDMNKVENEIMGAML